jgi:hypothetical protein
VRYLYRDPRFAIGSGNLTFTRGGHYSQYNLFNIAWRSTDRFRFLECVNPYWGANDHAYRKGQGGASPFQQTSAYDRTSIVLFNIPKADPFDRTSDRPESIQTVAMVRFPRSVDERTSSGEWLFLREADIYIAIRRLRAGKAPLSEPKASEVQGFDAVEIREAQAGFVFHVGSQSRDGSFKAFQAKALRIPLNVNWKTFEVSTRSFQGANLRMRFRPIQRDNPARKAVDLNPIFFVENKRVPFENWPLLSSPAATLQRRILQLRRDGRVLKVDWSGAVPKISGTR